MVRGAPRRFLARACGLLADSCGVAEVSWRNPDEALEMVGKLALVGEAGACGDFRQGNLGSLQKVLGPLDAALDDVLVRGQPSGRFELPCEMVSTEVGDRG